MTPANIETETKQYLLCPTCNGRVNENDTVDRIKELGSFGPWMCGACGQGYRGYTKDGVLFTMATADKKIPIYMLMQVVTADGKPLSFIIGSHRYVGSTRGAVCDPETQEEILHHLTYLYNEHSCPTNWINHIEKLVYDGDDDPHGMLRFVTYVDQDKAVMDGETSMGQWGELNVQQTFPEHFK